MLRVPRPSEFMVRRTLERELRWYAAVQVIDPHVKTLAGRSNVGQLLAVRGKAWSTIEARLGHRRRGLTSRVQQQERISARGAEINKRTCVRKCELSAAIREPRTCSHIVQQQRGCAE